MVDLLDLKSYVELTKSAVDLMKSAYSVLPKGPQRDEAEDKIKAAEDILRRSDAKLAKELNYQLCQCSFPPQIMLWREAERAFACPAPGCGHKIRADDGSARGDVEVTSF
jgi:hypothetical protein